jgi:biopolymer transport protein TolR
VTSLLDITMVLLISFMIIAPTLQSGINVDLPEVEDAEAIDTKATSVLLSVALDKENGSARILINEEPVALESLRSRLEKEHRLNPRVSLVVQGDKGVPWQDMAAVIGAVQASGIQGMSLVTIPPPETD